MKFHELKGRPVVGIADAHRLGTVDNLILDPPHHRILGLVVKTGGLFGPGQALLLQDVNAVGQDAVTIQDASRLNDQSKFAELKGHPTLDAVLGAKVVSEDGTELGSVADVTFDLEQAAITEYILNEGLVDRLRGQEHFIPVSKVQGVGQRLITVSGETSS